MGDPNPKRGNGELQDGGEAGPQRDHCVPGCGATSPEWRSEVPREDAFSE